MSVRRRSWTNRDGSRSEAWLVDHIDQRGRRHVKTFDRRKDADAYHAIVAVDVRKGVHLPDSESITVAEAGRLWLQTGDGNGLERTTLDAYRQRLELHIIPLIGTVKLSQLTVPMVRHFEDQLRKNRSSAMVRQVLVALSGILADAQERGLVSQNVARGLRARRARGKRAAGRSAPARQTSDRRPHPGIGGNPKHRRPPQWPLEAANPDGNLHRTPRFRIARVALGRRGSEERRIARPPARRLLPPDRRSEIGSRRAHHPAHAEGYGHLFPRGDDGAELAAAEQALF